MMNRKMLAAVAAMATVAAVTAMGMASKSTGRGEMGSSGMEKTSMAKPAQAVMYVCPKCEQMSPTKGKCAMCGAEMAPMHVLGVKDGATWLCSCGPDCDCAIANASETKCKCGKDIVKIPMKQKTMEQKNSR